MASAHDGVLIGPVAAPRLHVMTLNLRRPVPHLRRGHPDSWRRRAAAVRDLLDTERPTVLGLQEVLPEPLEVVLDALGPRYRAVGRGRGRSGGGEASVLVVDTARLDLVDWRQHALSDTPDVPGSRSWGNLFPRGFVEADLRDRATARPLHVVVTHLDHLSARSRLLSARAIAAAVRAAAAPSVVLGDANAPADSAPHRALAAAPLVDGWCVAERRATDDRGTYPHYRAARPGARRIDWALVSPGLAVRCAAADTRPRRAGWPSDHAPVQLVIEAAAPGAAAMRGAPVVDAP